MNASPPVGHSSVFLQKRVMLLNMQVEGMSMRAMSRSVGVSINTVTKLLVEAGKACAVYHGEAVQHVKAAPTGAGDVWTWAAIDSDSKMILSYEVGDRSAATAIEFMDGLRNPAANLPVKQGRFAAGWVFNKHTNSI